MQFITLAIVSALVGASPIPAPAGRSNGLSWSISGNTRQLRGGLRAAQDSEDTEEDAGPLGLKSNLKVFSEGSDEPSAQICYKDCGDDYSDSGSEDDDKDDDDKDDDGKGDDASDSDSDDDNDSDSANDTIYRKPHKAVGGSRGKPYKYNAGDSYKKGGDSNSDNYSKGGYGGKYYKGVGAGSASRGKSYKGVGESGGSYKKGKDSDSDSDSDSDDDSSYKGADGYKRRSYDAVGGKGNSRGKSYYSAISAGGASRDNEEDSDSDSDDDSGYKGKSYNGVGGMGGSRGKSYKYNAGDSYKKGDDSGSDSGSDSE